MMAIELVEQDDFTVPISVETDNMVFVAERVSIVRLILSFGL